MGSRGGDKGLLELLLGPLAELHPEGGGRFVAHLPRSLRSGPRPLYFS
jgi:hypothetical protein